MIKQIKIITLLLLTFFFIGCLWIPPIPTKKHNVSKKEINSISIGHSNKKGIYKILGKPNRLEHDKFCVYEVERSYGYFIWAVPGGAGGGELSGSQYRILVEFDENDTLKNYDIEKGVQLPNGLKWGVVNKSASIKTHKAVLLWEKPQFYSYHPGIAASSNELLLAVKRLDKPIWLINLETIEKAKLNNTEYVQYFTLSPDGKYLAYVLDFVYILDTATWRQVHIFKGHGKLSNPQLRSKVSYPSRKSGPSVLAFFPDGNMIASGGQDGFVKIWETITGIEINSFKAYKKYVGSIAVSPDGKMLTTAGDTGIILWDPLTGYELDRIKSAGDFKYLSYGLKFSPNGNILAINEGSHVELIRINKKLRRFEGLEDVFLLPFAGYINIWHFLIFSKDGRSIAASNGSAIVWDIERQEITWRYVLNYKDPHWSWRERVHPSVIHAIAFSRNKKLLFVTTSKGVFQIKPQLPD